MALMFLVPLLFFILKAEHIARKGKTPFDRLIGLGLFLCLLMTVSANFLTATFLMRDGAFIIAISYAGIAIVAGSLPKKTISAK
jgi:cell division protein FtsW (lipid II flippase)